MRAHSSLPCRIVRLTRQVLSRLSTMPNRKNCHQKGARRMRRPRSVIAVLAAVAATALAAGVAVQAAPARTKGVTLSLVAYSTPRDAFGSAVEIGRASCRERV